MDALCIDQDDYPKALPEKSGQIQKMALIYSQPTGVSVWLGKETANSSKAIRSIDGCRIWMISMD